MESIFGRYRLALADDEKQIREGLMNIVDWASIGFEAVGAFSDGKDIIEFVSNTPVDVVLLDINMPVVNGLEVAKYIWEASLKTKVVLLTGHKDFEYAKKACEYGVSFYLLKPTDIVELYKTFEKLKQQLDRERQERANVDIYVENTLEQFFYDLYFGAFVDEEALAMRLGQIGMEQELSQAAFTVLNLNINNYEEINKRGYGKEHLYKAIKHFLEMKYPEHRFTVLYRKEENVTYVVYGAGKLDEQAHESVAGEIKSVMGACVKVGVQGAYSNIYEFFAARLRDTTATEFVDLKQLVEKQKLLFSHLFSNEGESAEALFCAIFESLNGVDEQAAHGFIQNMLKLLGVKIADLGIVCDRKLFELPPVSEGRQSVRQRGLYNICEIAKVVGGNIQGTENSAISSAKAFINENYARDILLEDVAHEVFLSPAYLSRIFKKHVGETFSSYLFKVRMSKAEALLKNSNLKIYEISEKVGIQTSKYFFKLFKAYKGLTPTEFRKKEAWEGKDEG